MSALLDSVLSPEQRAAANAADMLQPRRSPFDLLIAHIEAARADAAGMVGHMTEMDRVHEMLDEALCFARAECFAVDAIRSAA